MKIKCRFQGCAFGRKGHRLWCIEEENTLKIVITRDVTFEYVMCKKKGCDTSVSNNDQGASQKVEFATQASHKFKINI